MEKNNKKISLSEIIIVIIVFVSVVLILVDMALNVQNEIDLQAQNTVGALILPMWALFISPDFGLDVVS
jgi:hypothetical protein